MTHDQTGAQCRVQNRRVKALVKGAQDNFSFSAANSLISPMLSPFLRTNITQIQGHMFFSEI
jgi:hypothetical protein